MRADHECDADHNRRRLLYYSHKSIIIVIEDYVIRRIVTIDRSASLEITRDLGNGNSSSKEDSTIPISNFSSARWRIDRYLIVTFDECVRHLPRR